MDQPTTDQWRAVIGYEGLYEVNALGHVRRSGTASSPNAKVGRVLRGTAARKDKNDCPSYRLFSTDSRGVYKQVLASTIVAAAWIGPRPTGLHINHLDGNRKNNAVANLEYVTHANNIRHARDVLGKIARQRLTAEQVRVIKARLATGATQRGIAREYGVSHKTINSLALGASWRHDYVANPHALTL